MQHYLSEEGAQEIDPSSYVVFKNSMVRQNNVVERHKKALEIQEKTKK